MKQTSPGHPNPSMRFAWPGSVTAWREAQVNPHTRRSYETAWNAFCRFLDSEPWAATGDDVNAWIASLREPLRLHRPGGAGTAGRRARPTAIQSVPQRRSRAAARVYLSPPQSTQ